MSSSMNTPESSESHTQRKDRGGNSRRPGRGRGNHKGGRGRGGSISSNRSRGNGGGQQKLTHFISIPLGHIPALRSRIDAFTSSLLAASPPIPGLDESIVIAARRLHLTLGVMSLEGDEPYSATSDNEPKKSTRKTLQSALSHLQSLKEPIVSLLQGKPLCIPLEVIDIMKPERSDPDKAHVMFIGPSSNHTKDKRQYDKLMSVCDMINKDFIRAGFVIDDRRPLKLHCTLLNTIYRRPRPQNGRREPFSFSAILASDATRLATVSSQEQGEETTSLDNSISSTKSDVVSSDTGADSIFEQVMMGTIVKPDGRPKAAHDPCLVAFGTWEAHEIHICEMGSKGPEGEYVSVGKIRIT